MALAVSVKWGSAAVQIFVCETCLHWRCHRFAESRDIYLLTDCIVFLSHSVDCSVVVKELHEKNISTCALRDDGVKFCIYWGSHKRAKSNRKKEKF